MAVIALLGVVVGFVEEQDDPHREGHGVVLSGLRELQKPVVTRQDNDSERLHYFMMVLERLAYLLEVDVQREYVVSSQQNGARMYQVCYCQICSEQILVNSVQPNSTFFLQ